jgi:hypothetical protein
MALDPSTLEGLISTELESQLTAIYGEVLNTDPSQKENLKKLVRLIAKSAYPLIKHLVAQNIVNVGTPSGPGTGKFT